MRKTKPFEQFTASGKVVRVYPGSHVEILVNLDEAADEGGWIEFTPSQVLKLVQAWLGYAIEQERSE